VAPSRGTCDVRYNSLTKTEGWMDEWKGKFKNTVTTKRKFLAPQTLCRRRKGVSMPKKWRRGGESEANVGGYSMYTQRHLMLSSTFKHQQ